ncbi:MAG: hypothetical protein BGO69_17145 [Bacteroidetes bacterium 46-16]|nr:MAG: hypothetical protein BGO69_17145 [Bacteroidetes bacterium 46-16]
MHTNLSGRASKNAVIYCRVSTKEQVDEGNSLASQEKHCKDYAIKNGYTIVEKFIEQGQSAKNTNRTELNRMLAYCTGKKNDVQAVIAYKVDRIARNIDDYRYIKVKLRKYGVEIRSTSEYFEDTPAGRFMENIIANVAQFDNDVRTERSIGGMKDAMREGRYVWVAPLGYSNMAAGGKSNIYLNNKAPLVRELFEAVARNQESVDVIRARLAQEGLTTAKGNLLTKSHTYKLLNNELYCGWINKFGERHRGLYEPLISEELFEQVQRVLKRRSHKGFIYQRENPDFPLRRFVHHPSGLKLTGHWAKGRNKRYAYYRFIGIRRADIPKDALEEAFRGFIERYTLRNEHIAYFKTALKETLGNTIAKDVKEADKLRAYIADLNDWQASLIDKNERGIISDSILKRQLQLVDDKLVQAHADLLAKPDTTDENYEEVIDFAAEYLKQPSATWAKASFEQRLKLQWFEFPKGIILENQKFRTKEIASIFKVKNIIPPVLSSQVPIKGQDYEQANSNKSPPVSVETCREWLKDVKRLADILREKPP